MTREQQRHHKNGSKLPMSRPAILRVTVQELVPRLMSAFQPHSQGHLCVAFFSNQILMPIHRHSTASRMWSAESWRLAPPCTKYCSRTEAKTHKTRTYRLSLTNVERRSTTTNYERQLTSNPHINTNAQKVRRARLRT